MTEKNGQPLELHYLAAAGRTVPDDCQSVDGDYQSPVDSEPSERNGAFYYGYSRRI